MAWYIEGGGNYVIKGEKVWGRNILIPVEEVEEKIRSRFKNVDAFATVYIYDRPDQQAAYIYAPLYIDLDLKMKGNQDYQKVKRDLMHVVTALNMSYAVPYEFIQVYFSGNKGFHVIVDAEVFGIEPSQNLNDIYRAIAHDLKKITLFKTVDTGIYDRVRLFRLPNSVNGTTGLYKVPVDYEFVRNSTYEEMIEYASMPREVEYPEAKLVREAARKLQEAFNKHKEEEQIVNRVAGVYTGAKKGDVLPCIKNMLNAPAAQGTRNTTTVVMASSLAQNGIEYAQANEMLIEWNNTHNMPKLSDKEVTRTVKSAYDELGHGKAYGCRAIKELGACVPTNCRLAAKSDNGGNKNGLSGGNAKKQGTKGGGKPKQRARY